MEDSMTEEAAAQVKCPTCGYMNSPDATMCAECGAPMPTGATSLVAPEQSGLIHREDGMLEVRVPIGEWEIRHSGRPQEAFTVRGYAAVFNQLSLDLGGFREKIDPTAFDKVLTTNPDVHFVWDHDTRYTLSRTRNGTLALRTDEVGLHMDAQVGPFSYAKDLRTALEGGYIDQASFAFHVEDGGDEWEMSDAGAALRTVRSIDGLYDVTVTAKGAYPQTSLVTVRSLMQAAIQDGRLSAREFISNSAQPAGATPVAPPEVGEQESQQGSEADPEIEARRARLLNRAAVARDDIGALSERLGKL
jgi:HK97 family phage prohead protease